MGEIILNFKCSNKGRVPPLLNYIEFEKKTQPEILKIQP